MTALLTFRISLYLPDTYPATNTRASNLSTACLSCLPLPGRSRVETMQNNENLFVPAPRAGIVYDLFTTNEGFATIRSNRVNASQDPTMIRRNVVNTDGGKRTGKEYLCRISIDRFTVQPLITVQTTSRYFPNSKRRRQVTGEKFVA